jgi:hypothetical protein
VTLGKCTCPRPSNRSNSWVKVRQDRLGHTDPRTTMGYTHVIGDDHRKGGGALGGFFAQVRLNLPKNKIRRSGQLPGGGSGRLGRLRRAGSLCGQSCSLATLNFDNREPVTSADMETSSVQCDELCIVVTWLARPLKRRLSTTYRSSISKDSLTRAANSGSAKSSSLFGTQSRSSKRIDRTTTLNCGFASLRMIGADHIHPQPLQACFQFAAHGGCFQAVPDLALVIPH